MKKLWPLTEYHYQEEIALNLLHLKSYHIEDAILSLIFDREEITKLIKIKERERINNSKYILEKHLNRYLDAVDEENGDERQCRRI